MAAIRPEQLVVKADFSPRHCGGTIGAWKRTIALTRKLQSTGVTIKSETTLRAQGYEHILGLRQAGAARVCADLKLTATERTAHTDAEGLLEFKPNMVTAMASSDPKGLRILRSHLWPNMTVFGVTVLSSMHYNECMQAFGASPYAATVRLAKTAADAGLDGIVLSGEWLERIQDDHPELSFLKRMVVGGRPCWARVMNDDQTFPITPRDAIRRGADYVVIGSPIVDVIPSLSPRSPHDEREATQWCLAEMAMAAS